MNFDIHEWARNLIQQAEDDYWREVIETVPNPTTVPTELQRMVRSAFATGYASGYSARMNHEREMQEAPRTN